MKTTISCGTPLIRTLALAMAMVTLHPDLVQAATPPNILIVLADDATYTDLPLFGGKNVATPNLDRLASAGMRFDRAYLTMSMCVPCRAELYTGLYPVRNGVCWNHAPARGGLRSIVHHLGELGYRVGLTGKKHASPPEVFPFEDIPGFEPDCVAMTAGHDLAGITEFMTRRPEQPFCLVVGLVVPHVPWSVGDPDHFDPETLVLPRNFVDTPATRRDYACYLAEIEVMDRQLGDILGALERTGQADRTLVLFSSEQGAQFPGCKWTNWDQGVHTAMVIRWPSQVEPGARTDAIVQYADVLPTLIELAGGDPKAGDLDGRSFLPVLLGKANRHRDFAYAMHNNVPEGPPYPIRAITDGRYRFIRNLAPSALYIEKHLMGPNRGHDYWLTWIAATAEDPRALEIVQRYVSRPAEELYETSRDPFEMRNLADDARYAAIKDRLAAELDRWMAEQGDPGSALDTRDQHEAARNRRHFTPNLTGE